MKIFDCFMYFDEDLVLDLRLNTLNKFVDQFVIVESAFNHNGEKRRPLFDIGKFKKFKDKINYILVEEEPTNLKEVLNYDKPKKKINKQIMNALKRENHQRNLIVKGLEDADDEDWIIVSDLDEIPNLETHNLKKKRNKFVFFRQLMIYYKLNLALKDFPWIGSKACRKKDLMSPQWLRNIKDRNYSWWRFDTIFSNTKYSDIEMINEGGWHFSYIKSPENIEKKLKSYLHHLEYEQSPLGITKIKELIKKKRTVYNLKADSRSNKFNQENTLEKLDINYLPRYVKDNLIKFNDWIEK
ncbi:hypothetical protein IDH20_00105 [Pelagibacterales bacterium SAG-MED39]|nr:hypothetical protein [Pelagibacterales bacterium SAG-MED39]